MSLESPVVHFVLGILVLVAFVFMLSFMDWLHDTHTHNTTHTFWQYTIGFGLLGVAVGSITNFIFY